MYLDILTSRPPLLGSPTGDAHDERNGHAGAAARGIMVPRTGTTGKTIPCSLFDRAMQFIADGLKLGSAYRIYCLSSNLELLCKKPEEWKKDSRNFLQLECHIKECQDMLGVESALKRVLGAYSESSLLTGFAALNHMQEKCISTELTPGEPAAIGILKTGFISQHLNKASQRIVKKWNPHNPLNSNALQEMRYAVCDLMELSAGLNEDDVKTALKKSFDAVMTPAAKISILQQNAFGNASNIHSSFQEKYPKLGISRAVLQGAIYEAAVGRKNNEGALQVDMRTKEKMLPRADLKKKLEKCFNDYYRNINAERFESSGTENMVRKLFGELAGLEKSNIKDSDVSFFLREIKKHVENHSAGREGALLQKVARENSGFKKNNVDMKKLNEFLSISTVLDFSPKSTDHSRIRLKNIGDSNHGEKTVSAHFGTGNFIL
ncbi:hypothetical protein [Noviherbaspirillum soli]|uniref:hypothetical protein n=1 Tax=Noviherbaspirillum soli TaxID=1064518 RepID=UPI00188D0C33|nr:hypothetical protein [Noviherbaspirillum soli]